CATPVKLFVGSIVHTHAGDMTDHSIDFSVPGGTLHRSRGWNPGLWYTDSSSAHITSSTLPHTSGVVGSRTCQPRLTNSDKRRQALRSISSRHACKICWRCSSLTLIGRLGNMLRNIAHRFGVDKTFREHVTGEVSIHSICAGIPNASGSHTLCR